MFDTVQETVDRLAAAIERSVVVLDPDFTLLAHSRHFEPLDDAELHLIGQRTLPPELGEAIRSTRGFRQRTPFTLPASKTYATSNPRHFIPLQSRYQLLGTLALVGDGDLDPEQRATLDEAAEVCRHLLEQVTQSIDAVNATIEAEMLGLLTDESITREAAARELNSLGMFGRSANFIAMTLKVSDEWSAWGGPPPREVLSRLLLRAITTPMIDAYSFVPTVPTTFILVGFASQPRPEAVASIVHRIEAELLTARDGEKLAGTVGIGGVVNHLADSWQSFDQAVVAADVARSTGQQSGQWDENSGTTALATLLASPPPEHLRTSSLRRLDEADADTIRLLESYFAMNGRAADIAGAIGVHRGTVYHRLERTARELGLNLDDADDRLVIQAWLAQRRFRR
ncbi:helix-turn-helix domain-containing protein [Microbacterium sp. CCNWLW134]|uniref:PucR family transcriptional regulator n=1 Tax=Microbacterium sp. CCNWLW134 TaxID=3122064 RepID=UPI00300FC13A